MKQKIDSIQDIMKKIESELKKDKSNRVIAYNDFKEKSYKYSDFTQYNDIEFIKKIFIEVLKRTVDQQGLNYYLQLLKNRERTKEEIITEIRYTKEGKQIGVKIKGSKLKHIIFTISKIPILGKIFDWIILFINLPKYIKMIYYSQNKKRNISNINKSYDNEYIKNRDKFNKFYIAFENEFRGDKTEIKERLQVYIPYIKEVASKESNFLDIGCGRGEWLECLQDNGYFNIKGIDTNSLIVKDSENFKFNVIEADAINYCKQLEDKSIKVITGFHIIEHLQFEKLMQLFEESYRVLENGGIMIFETPNPENLIVGACNFYTDMTHFNPLVPRTIEFLAQYIGFKNIEIKRLHPRGEASKLKDLKLREVVDWMNCGQDYAIIGYKY